MIGCYRDGFLVKGTTIWVKEVVDLMVIDNVVMKTIVGLEGEDVGTFVFLLDVNTNQLVGGLEICGQFNIHEPLTHIRLRKTSWFGELSIPEYMSVMMCHFSADIVLSASPSLRLPVSLVESLAMRFLSYNSSKLQPHIVSAHAGVIEDDSEWESCDDIGSPLGTPLASVISVVPMNLDELDEVLPRPKERNLYVDTSSSYNPVNAAIDEFLAVTSKCNVRPGKKGSPQADFDMSQYSGNDATMVWWKVQQILSSMYGSVTVHIYGSFATGVWLPGASDLDLLVSFHSKTAPRVDDSIPLASSGNPQYGQSLFQPRSSSPPVEIERSQLRVYLYAVQSVLATQPWCKSIKLINSATMPLIKMVASIRPGFELPVDISFNTNDHYGLEARDYVIQLTEGLPILRGLVLLLKRILHHHKVQDVYTGGLGSYSLTLLVVYFLSRCGIVCDKSKLKSLAADLPPVYAYDESMSPEVESCLQMSEIVVQKATGACREYLQVVANEDEYDMALFLKGFLKMFSSSNCGGLDLSQVGIRLDSQGQLFHQSSLDIHERGPLCIKDPITRNPNLGHGSFNMALVQQKLAETHELLIEDPERFVDILKITELKTAGDVHLSPFHQRYFGHTGYSPISPNFSSHQYLEKKCTTAMQTKRRR